MDDILGVETVSVKMYPDGRMDVKNAAPALYPVKFMMGSYVKK